MDYHADFDECLISMIDSVKGILYYRNTGIFDRIDFYNDEIYLEPLLYRYLALNEEKWIDSIIYGYEHTPKKEIQVFSNSYGAVYLPQIGYFLTNSSNATFTLSYENEIHSLFLNGSEIIYDFEPLRKLSYGLELIVHPHPLLEQLFPNAANDLKKETLSATNNLHVHHINKVLNLLDICNPAFAALFRKGVKKVMLFDAEAPNSLAVLAAHNMIFLNVNTWDTELYFVDHFSHEGSHVIFNTLTYLSKVNLFKIHYTTTFAEASGRIDEHSTVYLRFHGLFTFVEIIESLTGLIEKEMLNEKELKEAKGRLTFQLKRFENSLKSFEGLDIFQEEGFAYYKFFLSSYQKWNNKYGHLRTVYDLSDQSYDFNSEIFHTLNPIVADI